MKNKILILVAAVAMAFWSTWAMADIITFTTIPGSLNSAGSPINAQVSFITSANNLEIQLVNLEANPTDVGQDISGLSFVLSNGLTSATLTSFSAIQRKFNTGGTYTDTDVSTALGDTTYWQMTTNTTGGLTLQTIVNGNNEETIMGPPDSNNIYSQANASFNADHHPPEWFGDDSNPVIFNLNIPGITADDTVTSAVLSFGTSGKDNHQTVVPLPGAFLLLGAGLVRLVTYGRRRKLASPS